jgi:Spy/CpxP family protein refolding chaperone
MKPSYRMLASLAALSAAVCVSSVSFAQEPPPGAAPPPAGAEPRADGMREHAEARAKALHDILNLRPDQDAAFQALQAAMRPSERMGDRHDKGAMEGLTTPERLDRMAARMADRQAAFQRRADAIKQFYAVLSPEQQRAFDALPGLIGGDRHGRHGPGGPGGPGHSDGPHGDS